MNLQTTPPHGPHRDLFRENVAEVDRLLKIHSLISGSEPGRKHHVEVLNKSAIVLLTATWESYIEELAKNSFTFMIQNAENHKNIPNKVLTLAVKEIRSSKNDLDVWKIAGNGWKTILDEYKNEVIKKHVDSLNSPKSHNVDELFESILGLKGISKNWYWKGMSNAQCIKKLETLIEIRGDIAHTVQTASSVTKSVVIEYTKFLKRIATISHNRCNEHLEEISGSKPWRNYHFGSTK